MSSPTQPILIPVRIPGEGSWYRLIRPWRYVWDLPDGTRQCLVVPRGFCLDGASVPRLLWTLTGITPDGLHRAAAVAHDYLYRHAGKLPAGVHRVLSPGVGWETAGWKDAAHVWTREEADRLFARLLRECGVGKRRRRIMYLGVRLGGWMSWKG
ncbi:DUF1353 domain-containing protein [Verrucomicrobium spinosum]|uniref:DUF1353 domain-containing protein n=1 Tax=Verrucomicrobium spinosum TaxID=2736 RepID=UPI001E298BDB|nr:DUF1353 domain-containing protein [Verrucomicrobium spinosum]